ncbi:MAG: hypothetical protein EBR30_27025 [Cytophagia bacterium]|nr:hypothetical protein [Cytophagia bacterium]
MGKMKELFMQMREQELITEQQDIFDDEYQYELYIQHKYKSPTHVCFMTDNDGELVMLQGYSHAEIFDTAKKHGLQGEFKIMSPTKHLF